MSHQTQKEVIMAFTNPAREKPSLASDRALNLPVVGLLEGNYILDSRGHFEP
jgi:hypothetical protein